MAGESGGLPGLGAAAPQELVTNHEHVSFAPTLLTSLLGAPVAALAQTYTGGGQTNIGFRADTMPERSECGIGALMP